RAASANLRRLPAAGGDLPRAHGKPAPGCLLQRWSFGYRLGKTVARDPAGNPGSADSGNARTQRRIRACDGGADDRAGCVPFPRISQHSVDDGGQSTTANLRLRIARRRGSAARWRPSGSSAAGQSAGRRNGRFAHEREFAENFAQSNKEHTMKTCSYLLVFLLAGAGVLAAQNDSQAPPEKPRVYIMRDKMHGGMPGMGFGHDWWRNSELAQKIGLSQQQTQQLNQIFSSHRANLAQMRANVEIEEGKLSDLLDQDQPQQDQVLAQVTQLQNARNALEKEFTVMTLAFRGVLTPDQWKQLQSMSREKMFFRMHKPGPGGPGDGPPPMPPSE